VDQDSHFAAFLTRQTRPKNAYEETIQRILQSIRLGIIAPGERLPAERELAEMLKVSRDTVREAMAILVQNGYVISKRGRYGGTFVVDHLPEGIRGVSGSSCCSEAELQDISVLRKVIEAGAARVAASRPLSAGERASLQSALDESREVRDLADYRRLDSRLHLRIAELTDSQTLVQMMADLRTRVNDALDTLPLQKPNVSNSNEQHAAIVHAILTGQPEQAARAMLDHIEGSEALLIGFHGTASAAE